MAGFGLGFAAGGFSDALSQGLERQSQDRYRQGLLANQQQAQQSLDNYRTQELKLQQQAQANAQQREFYVRTDKSIADAMDVVTKTIEHGLAAGNDRATVAKSIQPMMEPIRRLYKSSGRDVALLDAQVATSLSAPSGFDMLNGGGKQPARSAEPAGGGADTQPGTAPASFDNRFSASRPQSDDVDQLTRALAVTDNPGLKQAFAIRLQDALRQRGDSTVVHFAKTENGTEIPLFIDKRNRTVTDLNGNPYVPPTGDDSDNQRIVTAIKEGRQPPTVTGLYKNAKAVRAGLEREGFNLTQAQLEWESAQKQIKSLNGPQMVRYAGLSTSVINTIDEVKALAKEMNNSGVPLANYAKIQAYIQTAGNTENGKLAARYVAAVNTLKEEFANLAQGGYAPTEAAWKLANDQINGNYGVDELGASLGEVQRLLRYRMQGIPNFSTLGPGAPNRFVPGTGGGAAGHGGQTETQSGQVGPVQWQLVK